MNKDFVLGPTFDGGFWLFGARKIRKIPIKTFKNVRWSSTHAYDDTIKTLETDRWASCDMLSDVDNGSDYINLQKKMIS
jgi:hypothetical protein